MIEDAPYLPEPDDEPDRGDRDEDRPESSRRPQTNDVALREARQLLDVIGSLDGL